MNWDHFNQVVYLRNSGRVQESVTELERIRSKESDAVANAVILMEVVNGLRVLKRYSEARGKINEASGLIGPAHELYPRLLFLEALVETDEKQWSNALSKLDSLSSQYESLLQSEEHRDLAEEIQRIRGTALVNLGRFAEAIPLLKGVRSVEYDREATLVDLGVSHFATGQFDAAREDFDDLLSLSPGSNFSATAHFYRGMIYFKKGYIAKAKREFEECMQFPDRSPLSDDDIKSWLIACSKELG